jgi:uncharacterized cupin superfamily protein
MKTIHLTVDGQGESRIDALPLPCPVFGPKATGREVVGEPVGSAAVAFGTARVGAGVAVDGPRTRSLRFLLEGRLRVDTTDGTADLEPGDVMLVDDLTGPGHRVEGLTDVLLLDVELDDSWVPSGAVPPPTESGRPPGDVPRFRRIFVEEGVAHFAELPEVRAQMPHVQPVEGLSLTCLTDGVEGDWHTETAINLVIVLSGGFELEVPGEGAVQLFRAGDVCLVDDRTGKGHMTRTRGETRFAALTLPEDHSWNR